MAAIFVELDLLSKLGAPLPRLDENERQRASRLARRERDLKRSGVQDIGSILTCASHEALREESFREHANLPMEVADAYQIEAAQYGPNLPVYEICLGTNGTQDWGYAHYLSDRRLAVRLCYRKRIEAQFVKIVNWWRRIDSDRHFATAKQGTLLTAMLRGGSVSMMPWDSDLELALYSSGPNPVLGWCHQELEYKARASCIIAKLQREIGLECSEGPEFFPKWLYQEQFVFGKFRVGVEGIFDINFEGWVPHMPIAVNMFGGAEVRVTWPIWAYLFYEVFRGSYEKKVGTSGNIATTVGQCLSEHNACIPGCEDATPDRPCIFEFEDYFAHSRNPFGMLIDNIEE
eukprot:TRINITY_DN13616_c0_g1_i1.p1 TRINITY_DN13616_c0_g1~~TRINITY_DN13616_c0_g1_i1.p1  ORF type:complete len:370 (+),score=46.44 TRINITY_DN13616_c0_g1_i1:75-1112(+)